MHTSVCGLKQNILIDTGAPNTVITIALAAKLKLPPLSLKKSQIYLSRDILDVVQVILPELVLGTLRLRNVRVYTGLNNDWGDTIILGLNVLNHLVYTINRTKGSGFINIQLRSTAKNNFNHLISADGKYYITDYPEEGKKCLN